MKRLLLSALGMALLMPAWSQSDVSRFFMQNNGFDVNMNYDSSTLGNIAGDIINDIYGWNNETEITYTVAGTAAYNTAVTFNDSNPLPSKGYDGSVGALLLTTGWANSLIYTQEVTLPKGSYRLSSAYYNAGSYTQGSSLLAWLPDGATAVESKVASFPVGEWLTDELTFTLTKETKGKIRIGFKSIDGSSRNQAKLVVDYVNLLCDQIDKSTLGNCLTTARTAYGNGSGTGASELKAVIDRAQQIYDNASASVIDILEVTQQLQEATSSYLYGNATADKPYDVTALIVNPDFESGLAGWSNLGFNTQTNQYFPLRNGATYVERWVNRGSTVSDASICQTLSNLRSGKYRLSASAGNIQQDASESSTNQGDPQTGVKLYADFNTAEVNDIKRYTLPFSVVSDNVTIGLEVHNCTGNWVTLDNFTLEYLGANTAADFNEYIRAYIADIRANYLTLHVQNSVLAAARSTISDIESQLGSDTDETKAATLKTRLDGVIADIEASAARFKSLDRELNYANKVASWYADDADKMAILTPAITSATAVYNNLDCTDSQLSEAATTLKAAVQKVDKKVYTAQWSMGDVSDPNNAYYIGRTRQSKDWILFWEKGYGEDPEVFSCGNYVVNVDRVLEKAQIAFDYYTDVLKFITRGQSKTDTYKMVIRLRYEPTEWEASGSGVDDLIGLLTLTPYAIESRNFQTLFHEVGHCFQYQVHCDNNNQNGWMYAPGNGYGCAFWEQCAQWQAYKIMPEAQFNNEWFTGYLNNVHKHILHESARYNNYFIQDYWTYLHGIEFMGRLWNESKNPEDAVEAYMRITDISVSQFYDEMYDCAARFATWDIPALDKYGATKVASRPVPSMKKLDDGAWRINASVAPENTGHNIIRLNVPDEARKVAAEFEGLNEFEGYRSKYPQQAVWRFGFVAQLKDNSRVYGEMGKATYENPKGYVEFEVPDNCKRLYFVVTGGSKKYWRQVWDDNDNNDEQWPYQVKFGNTNRTGTEDMPELAVESVDADGMMPAIDIEGDLISIDRSAAPASVLISDLSGMTVAHYDTDTTLVSLHVNSGLYIIRVCDAMGHIKTFKTLISK